MQKTVSVKKSLVRLEIIDVNKVESWILEQYELQLDKRNVFRSCGAGSLQRAKKAFCTI